MREVSFPRVLVTVALMLIALVLLEAGYRRPHRFLITPLAQIPLALESWRGVDAPVERRIVEAAGVDEYVNRSYVSSRGEVVQLYIGYYADQRHGDVIHSPRNCLPGAGWQTIRSSRLKLALGGKSAAINEYLIQKGLERQLVLYWYHGRGHDVASEYEAKLLLMADAVTRNRTDGALVRVNSPIVEGEQHAHEAALRFIRVLSQQLEFRESI